MSQILNVDRHVGASRMEYLRLIKYPGSKNTILPDIKQVFADSGKDLFVDVFGGSGTVSLNVNAVRTVYNDISYDTSNLFRVLKHEGPRFRQALLNFLETVRRKSRGENPRILNRIIRERGELELSRWAGAPKDGEQMGSPGSRDLGNFRDALISFFRLSTSFGGMGSTYSTTNEKSVYRSLEKSASTIGKISGKVVGWKVENMDFRDLMAKYDGPESFFYLDPPYPGKDWYDNSFTEQDFQDIKKILDKIKGKYLLTFDARDDWLEDIFGKPAFVRSFRNQNAEQSDRTPRRRTIFYTNVRVSMSRVKSL